MKKTSIMILILIFMTTMICSCRKEELARKESMEKQIHALESELNDLKKAVKESSAETQSEQQTEPEITIETNETSTAETVFTYSLDDLEAEINELAENVNTVVTADTKNDRIAQFLDLKLSLEQAEDKLQLYEDELEQTYIKKEIDIETFRKEEQKIDMLEDVLELAEDYLEHIFGIDTD